MTKRTKYKSIESVPDNAMTVSEFAKKYKFKSSAYVHIKYQRHTVGYNPGRKGNFHSGHPGYDIYEFKGTCYVIVKDEGILKNK